MVGSQYANSLMVAVSAEVVCDFNMTLTGVVHDSLPGNFGRNQVAGIYSWQSQECVTCMTNRKRICVGWICRADCFECCFVPWMDRMGFSSAYRQPLTYIICIYAPSSVRCLSPSHRILTLQVSAFLPCFSVLINSLSLKELIIEFAFSSITQPDHAARAWDFDPHLVDLFIWVQVFQQ